MASYTHDKKNQIQKRLKKLYILLFKNYQTAFLNNTKRKESFKGKGFWVYYSSYTDFKKQQQKARLISFSAGLFIISAAVASLIVNLLFPIIFKSEAATSLVWRQDSYEDFRVGLADNNIDTSSPYGEIKLRADKNEKVLSSLDDFAGGHTPEKNSLSSANVVGINQGEITSNQGYTHTAKSTVAIADDHVTNIWEDETTNLIYVSTWGGLSVIDTKGTISPDDDQLVAEYTANSNPKIGSNYVYHSWLDKKTNYLYVSTWGGLSVIDTRGTETADDDELVFNYTEKSSPAIGYNKVRSSFMDQNTGLLYISTDGGGLSVIDTKKTTDPADDTLVITYSKNSNPALPSNRVYQAFLDRDGYLFASTWGGGLAIINTNKTPDPSDDTLQKIYSTKTEPDINSDKIYRTYEDEERGRLYLCTYGGGLLIIDTKKTSATFDDVIMKENSQAINQALGSSIVSDLYFDDVNDFAYISTNGNGLAVVDINAEEKDQNDGLVFKYNTFSQPNINSDNAVAIYVNSAGLIYVGTEGYGLSVITPGNYNKNAVYVSRPFSWDEISPSALAWENKLTNDQKVSLQIRSGSSEAVWQNHFDNEKMPEITGLWGGKFSNTNVENSVLKLNGRDPESGGASFTLTVAPTDNYFPAGSVVRARLKVDTADANFSGIIFTDEWDDGTLYFKKTNEWVILTLVANSAFSKVGFNLQWDHAQWKYEDGLEIDWLSVEQPQVGWQQWSSESLENNYSSIFERGIGDQWWQYRFNLFSPESKTAPTVASIKLLSGYELNGSYVSSIFDAQDIVSWSTVSAQSKMPDGTGINYFVRTGNTLTIDQDWTPWAQVSLEQNFSFQPSRYIQYKIDLSSNNDRVTPSVNSLRIGYSKIEKDVQ